MKICWDNIDDFKLTKNGNFRKDKTTYTIKNHCQICNNPYFTTSSRILNICSRECYYIYNDKRIEIPCSTCGRIIKVKRYKLKIQKNFYCNRICQNNKSYTKNNIPIYDTYQPQLQPYGIKCRRSSKDKNILEVRCMYCNKWYQPKQRDVINKVRAIQGKINGERNLYCSDNCKHACPTYNQQKYPKGFKQATSREVQPALRKLVLERDNWTCQKCGTKEKQLHCHHIIGIELNPIESADIDNCITLCKDCHNEVHKQKGCTYNDFKRKNCKN